MDRRHTLKALAAGPLAACATGLFAAPAAGGTRLLVVFLRGGYDAANLLVPVGSQSYYELRPNIAIARPDAGNANAALTLDTDWGLHPALGPALHPLYAAGQLAFVPFAGTHDTSRSHFETQDRIELGQDLNGPRDFQSGFLNRLVSVLGGTPAMSFTDQLPRVFQGPARVANAGLRSLSTTGFDARQSAVIASMYADTPLAPRVNQGFAVREEMRQMAAEMAAADRNALSTSSFEAQARRIARLMRERYHIGFVDVGGWDTHVGQGGASGFLATRLGELGRGLAAYSQEMGPAWRETVVVVLSEFGRTFRENGNRGTDHGHGTVYWVLGGGIRGAQVAGRQQRVEAATLFENRDYPVLNEYRAVLGGLLRRMYGLDAARLDRVFPGAQTDDIALV